MVQESLQAGRKEAKPKIIYLTKPQTVYTIKTWE